MLLQCHYNCTFISLQMLRAMRTSVSSTSLIFSDPEPEILWPRCLKLELDSEFVGVDQCLKFELEAELVGVELEAELMNVEILDVDSQDEVSVLTMTDEAEGLFTSPSPRLVLGPLDLEVAIRFVCTSTICASTDITSPYRETEIRQAKSVLGLSHLPLCCAQYKTKICPSVRVFKCPTWHLLTTKMIFGNSTVWSASKAVKVLGTHSDVKDQNDLCKNSFLVPGFFAKQECRKFWLCKPQFCNLFGLTEMDLATLETKWVEYQGRGCNAMGPFGWSGNLSSYCVGNQVYVASLQSC